MGILSLASGASLDRGYDYFQGKKVLSLKQFGDMVFTGVVSGSGGARYDVSIDVVHPRKSRCTCPHAAGRRVICKHMVALYFTAFPSEAEQYKAKLDAYWKEEEQAQVEIEEALFDYVYGMKKAELQEALITLLVEGPDWQYDRFVETYLDLDDEE